MNGRALLEDAASDCGDIDETRTVPQITVMTTFGESTVAAESLAGQYICRFCEIVRPQLVNFKLAFAYDPIFAQASVRKREQPPSAIAVFKMLIHFEDEVQAAYIINLPVGFFAGIA